MRNKRFINKTGYTPGSRTANNPVNIIPSQDITMQNVPYPLQATPLDEYGNPIGESSIMMPNQDYFFEDASFVEERPIMQMGGWQNPFGQGYSTEENPIMYNQPYPTLGNVQTPSIFNPTGNFDNIRQNAETSMQADMNKINNPTAPVQEENNGKPLYQFANPYSGQDFGSSLFNLGQSIGNQDSLGTAVFSGLTALKGASTFAQGLGSAKKSKQQQKSFYENFRQNMVGNSTYLQEGGEADAGQEQQLIAQVAEALQAGAAPEEILAKLVELGFPEEEAQQIIQSIMQQMGGQTQQEQVMQMGGTSNPQLNTTGYGAYNQVTPFGTIGRKQMNAQELEYVTNKTGLNSNQFKDNLPTVEKYLKQFRTGSEPVGSPLTDKNNGYTISENGRTNAGVYNHKTDTFNFANYQDGGEQQDITGQVAQALQSGADPQQILQQLIEGGMDENQATQLIQGIIGQMQVEQEAPQFQKGGTMSQKEQASVNAGITEAPIPEKLSNAEIEKNEYIFDSKGIRKALGETHEKDGTPVNLEPSTKVLSDHLKIGDASKKLSEKLGKKLKPTLTYAKALDVYNKESGIDDINDEIVKLTAQLEKEQRGKNETTADLNISFLIGKIKEKTDEKRPIEKEQQKMFDVLFNLQEDSKTGEEESKEEFKNDGEMKMLEEISEKYNIPLENLQKALPKFQAGGVSKNNTNSAFTNQPVANNFLPYTPIQQATYPQWIGENYQKQWVPWVEESLADPKRASQIEQWLLQNSEYGVNIREQIGNLNGQARIDRIKQLATDQKPGPFHNAVATAIRETAPPIQLNEVTITPDKKPNTVPTFTAKNNGQQTIMRTFDMPTRINNIPSWDPSLKVSTRLNRIDPALISPEQQLAETDRAVQSAQQDLQNLSPAMRAVANIGLTANQISSNNKVIQESNRFNAQATNQADIYNAKVGDIEQQAENQNALSYEARTLTGKGRYENDLNNMLNQQFRDQTEKWKAVQIYNSNNVLNPNAQFDGSSYQIYSPSLSDLNLNFINKPTTTETKKKPVKKKIGGRFKK